MRQHGVAHAGVFASVARCDALPHNYVDFLFDIAQSALHLRIVGLMLQQTLILQNRGGELSHHDVGLGHPFLGADQIILATELDVCFFEKLK